VPPPRFFIDVPLAVGAEIGLPEDLAHHALRVLRLRSGAPIILFNGRGGEFGAAFGADGARALARIVAFDSIERESPLQLTLLQALVAGDKLDWIVEKAVELGVTRIFIAPTQRSVVRLDAARGARRLVHWARIARAACSQCGRNRVPVIDYRTTFNAALAAIDSDQPRLLLRPNPAGAPLPTVPERRAALAVGPEGGFTDDEATQAVRAGFIPVQLGPRILRTETAGLAALAALQASSGDLAARTG